MNAELQTAKDLALRSGEMLLKYYAGEPSVEWKGKNDPVTTADRAVSRFIVDALRRHFPNDAILSEEEKDDLARMTKPRVWVIDPMDGTKEFIARNGEFSVMIGLAVHGVARLGVVYQPTEDKLYYASPQEGAHLTHAGTTQRLQVSETSDLSQATIALSRSHLSRATETIRKKLGIERSLQTGSLGLKIGLICERQADVYIQGRGTSLWDTCGPEAILHAAGGRMTDALGGALRYNSTDTRNLLGVIATNGVVHDKVVETVRAVREGGIPKPPRLLSLAAGSQLRP